MSTGHASGVFKWLDADSKRPVKAEPIKVFRASSLKYYSGAALGVLTFNAPVAMNSAGEEVARVYVQELFRLGVFRDVKLIPCVAGSGEEAVWLARTNQCDLIMKASVDDLLDGSGAMATHVSINVKILDARTGNVAWELQQEASSEPGKDRDFFWSVKKGAPAQRYPVIARSLARQLVDYLAVPLSMRKAERGESLGRVLKNHWGLREPRSMV